MKTILTISDEFISILIFKLVDKKPIYLFEDSIKLIDSEIKTNCIIDTVSFKNKLKKIIDNGSKFMGCEIHDIYLSLDINKVVIDNFNTTIDLPNKVLNKGIWEKINKVKISNESDRQILKLDTIKWNIDGLNVYNLDRTYTNVDNIEIYGKVFQISKIIYNGIMNIFSELKVNILKFVPVLMNFNYFLQANDLNTYELVCYLNRENLTLVLLHANHVIAIDNYDFGTKQLVNQIMIDFSINDFENIFNWLNSEDSLIYNSAKNLNPIIDYRNNCFDLKEISTTEINKIIRRYEDKLIEIIKSHLNELKNNRVNVNFISFFASNRFNEFILNLIKANLNIDSKTFKFNNDSFLKDEQNFNLLYMHNMLINEIDDSMNDFQKNIKNVNNEFNKGV